ncbi:MAG: phosphoglycerate kinase [Nitrospinota bacterium]
MLSDVDVQGKRVFIRVDFNVPFDENGNIADDSRIRGALPTIQYVLDKGGKVVLASHIGRPKGEKKPSLSMKLLENRVGELLKTTVKSLDDCVGSDVESEVNNLNPGEALLLENLRFYKEEEENDQGFARQLAALADLYVNDAFGTAHRAHASTAGITEHIPLSVAGFLMQKEIDSFNSSVSAPERPVAVILGGAKASTKIGVLKNLVGKVDKIIMGGGLAFTFLKAMGYRTGAGRVEEDMLGMVRGVMDNARDLGVKFYLPVDFISSEKIDETSPLRVVSAQEIPDGWLCPDIGPATSLLFSEALQGVRTVIWNGPMGVFEIERFSRGTMEMVKSVTSLDALTVVGGGDTDLALHMAGKSDQVSFVSTGGGAYLELLEGKALPGIEMLTERP